MEDFNIKLCNGKYVVDYCGQLNDFDSLDDACAWIEKFKKFLDASYEQECFDDALNDCVYM